jgi:hypothetical protein
MRCGVTGSQREGRDLNPERSDCNDSNSGFMIRCGHETEGKGMGRVHGYSQSPRREDDDDEENLQIHFDEGVYAAGSRPQHRRRWSDARPPPPVGQARALWGGPPVGAELAWRPCPTATMPPRANSATCAHRSGWQANSTRSLCMMALGQAPAKGHKEVRVGHLMESPVLGSLQRGGKGRAAQDRELD